MATNEIPIEPSAQVDAMPAEERQESPEIPQSAPPIADQAAPPRAEKTAKPKAAKSAPPKATQTAPPKAAKTVPPKAAKSAPPVADQAAPPRAEKTAKPKAAKTAPPKAAKTAPPKAAKTVPPKAAKTAPPKAVKTVPPKAAKTAPPKAAKAVKAKAAKTAPPKAAKTAPPKAVKTAPPKAAKTVPPKAAKKAKKAKTVKTKSKKSLKAKKVSKTAPLQTAQLISSEVVFQGPVFRVLHDRLIEPNGRINERDVVRHNGSVVILAIDPAKNKKDPWIVVERQYRHAANQYLWELPAGSLDADEDPLEGAQRELAEETGYTAKKWKPLVEYYASPGFLGESMKVFLAEGLVAGNARPEDDEEIEIRLVKLSEVVKSIEKGTILDGKTITSVLLYLRKLAGKKKK
jgi:ADP-ribose pyrophosphatase